MTILDDPPPAADPTVDRAAYVALLAEHGACTCPTGDVPCADTCGLCLDLDEYVVCPAYDPDGFPAPTDAELLAALRTVHAAFIEDVRAALAGDGTADAYYTAGRRVIDPNLWADRPISEVRDALAGAEARLVEHQRSAAYIRGTRDALTDLIAGGS